MSTKELSVTYEADGSEITLNPSIVLRYMIDPTGDVNISNKEMAKIIMTCKARNLNPFTGEVVINHYTGKDGRTTCSLVTTKDFFQRRAASNPAYKGKESGVCVLNSEGRPVRRPGTLVMSELGEKLVGGWCKVFVDGREPEYAEVSLNEYDQHQALWKSKPATMICKVAKSQALREAFPNEFNGLYEPEEMGLDETAQNPVEVIPEAVEPVTVTERIPVYEPNPCEIYDAEVMEDQEAF